MYTYVCTYPHMYVHMYVQHAHTQPYTHILYLLTCAYIHVHTYLHVHTCILTYICTVHTECTHNHTHTHTHTHCTYMLPEPKCHGAHCTHLGAQIKKTSGSDVGKELGVSFDDLV